MSELLGCPFCGGGSERVDGVPAWRILHTVDCFFRTRIVGYVLDGDVPKWNRRTPPIVGEDARDAVQGVIDQATTFIDSQPSDSPLRKQWKEWRNGMVLAYNALAADSSREKP